MINVHIGDEVSFVCPHKATNMAELSGTVSSDKLYENAFLLQPSEGEKYKTCNSSGKKDEFLLLVFDSSY